MIIIFIYPVCDHEEDRKDNL